MSFLSFLKAEKKVTAERAGSATQPAYQSSAPDEGIYKAYIPNFLYKPPFGYPLNKNVLHLKALAKNPFIFSVIRTLKDEASTCKWEIRYKKEYAGEGFKDTENADIKRISNWFYNPNANEESFGDIIGQWIQDLCEVDAAVGVKVFNKKNDFLHLYARDGGSFLKNPDIYGSIGNRDQFVYAYRDMNPNMTMPYKIKIYAAAYAETAAYYQYGWTGNALPVPFGRREIMYIMSNARSDSIYGRSPLEVIEEVLLTLIYGVQYNSDFYLNGNAPDGLINLVGADQDIAKAFQDQIRSKFRTNDDLLGNSRRIGHTYPVYGGPAANFVPFQLSAKDMEIIEQQKWFTKLVWSAFGVTPDEMGYTEDSNKAVSQTQTGVHKRKALKPLLKKIEYAINSQLMTELDPSGKLEFAFEDYDLDDELKKATLYKAQIDGGWKTAEMVAEEEGIDLEKLKAHKEEKAKQEMEMAQKTNPGFLPEPKTPSAKACAPIMKTDYLKMDLDDLIAEHKKLIKIMESDNDEAINKELVEQKKELESYIEKKKSASVKAEKDDISTYYERVRTHLLRQIEKEE
jgi:phage portal protein BeeE